MVFRTTQKLRNREFTVYPIIDIKIIFSKYDIKLGYPKKNYGRISQTIYLRQINIYLVLHNIEYFYHFSSNVKM